MTEPEQHKTPHFGSKHYFNGTFIATAGRYIVSFLCGALVSAYVVGGKTQQLTDLIFWRGETEARMKIVEKSVGDNSYEIKSEAKDAAAYDARLKKVEEQTAKIDTMIYKIDGLVKSVEELKAQKR